MSNTDRTNDKKATRHRVADEEARTAQLTRGKTLPGLIALALLAVVVVVVFGRFCSAAATIHVTVNGTPLTLHGAKTMETAVRECGLPINPGDLISLEGNVLKRSEGYPFYATVNGEETADPDFALQEGDVVEVTDGKDKVEDYDAVEDVHPHGATITGMGSLCLITPGADGIVEHRTGRISGEQVDKVTQQATDTTVAWHSPDTQGEKVVALTFEQGPDPHFTAQILDLLEENEARATFFFVGDKAKSNPELVQRAWFDYNQICTNTYDRSVTKDSPVTDLPAQIRSGRQAISDIVDGAEVNRIVRLPEIPVTEDVAVAVEGEVDVIVGWDIDTADWIEYNTAQVYDAIMDAEPGDIVLMRDGGGDRSATVEALRRALPNLKRKGFSFVTVSELLDYPFLSPTEQ